MEIPEPTESEDDPLNLKVREQFGLPGLFPYQRLAIVNVLESVDSNSEQDTQPDQIVLLPTGSGKSLCFMLPAVIIEGITLVVFPILSLISDQLRRCASSNISALALRGGMSEAERSRFEEECSSGRVKMIFTNPEMLTIPQIRSFLAGLPIRHLVIDEAHTVPEWGETFRPACLELIVALRHIHPAAVSAFTATASPEIIKKIRYHLFPGGNPRIISGNPDRVNIFYTCRDVLSPHAALVHYASILDKPMIVFCQTRKGAERTALLLKERLGSEEIRFYHAGLTREEKTKTEKWFFPSEKGILTATCAYGMGVDKPDIRSVIHLSPPPSPEAYLQESGRAGRDGLPAHALLLVDADQTKQSPDKNGYLSPEDKRKNKLLDYARNHGRCRREKLLSFLDHEADDCSGCDVCTGNALPEAEELPLFRTMLSRRNRIFPPSEAVKLLKGIPSPFLKERDWHKSRWFGVLSEWYMEEIAEALKCGIRSGYWRIAGFGTGKGNLSLCRKRKKRLPPFEDSLFEITRDQQNDLFR